MNDEKAKVSTKPISPVNAQGIEENRSILIGGITGEENLGFGFVDFLLGDSAKFGEGGENCIAVVPVSSSKQSEVIRKEQVRIFQATNGNGDWGPTFASYLIVNVSSQSFHTDYEPIGRYRAPLSDISYSNEGKGGAAPIDKDGNGASRYT